MGSRVRKCLASLVSRRRSMVRDGGTTMGIGEPSIYHALVIIFLEFFSWGLLTVPIINVLAETFPDNKFLMNGVILGIKGFLSFLAAPLIGSLSDIWGRKFFLLVTVFCTCIPIPLLRLSPWWYFALFSISGIFSVTFSVVLAYVADITDNEDRNEAYGLVSATFGASLVISPALGAYMSEAYSDDMVVALASAISALDMFFILVAVPESLPEKQRQNWDSVSWEHADPFASLKKVGEDRLIVYLCIIVFLSYLPEAGQFSCFFVYLKLIVGFSPEAIAAFIGLIGVLSVIAQTGLLMILHTAFGARTTIMIGLVFQFIQLVWYGLGTHYWMMWVAGFLAAISQITYPSLSAYVSIHSDPDKQGTVQGIVTGIRGLCSGLGPALFGFIFYLFNVDLGDQDDSIRPALIKSPLTAAVGGRVKIPTIPKAATPSSASSGGWTWLNDTGLDFVSDHLNSVMPLAISQRLIPGPPFIFGACLVLIAMLVILHLPKHRTTTFLISAANLDVFKPIFRRFGAQSKTATEQGVIKQPLVASSRVDSYLTTKERKAFRRSSSNSSSGGHNAAYRQHITGEQFNFDNEARSPTSDYAASSYTALISTSPPPNVSYFPTSFVPSAPAAAFAVDANSFISPQRHEDLLTRSSRYHSNGGGNKRQSQPQVYHHSSQTTVSSQETTSISTSRSDPNLGNGILLSSTTATTKSSTTSKTQPLNDSLSKDGIFCSKPASQPDAFINRAVS